MKPFCSICGCRRTSERQYAVKEICQIHWGIIVEGMTFWTYEDVLEYLRSGSNRFTRTNVTVSQKTLAAFSLFKDETQK